VLVATFSSVLSVIFFDVKCFNVALLGAIGVRFLSDLVHAQEYSVLQLIAGILFQGTAVFFSSIVGRRRSLSKHGGRMPGMYVSGNYLDCLKYAKRLDVLDVGVRLQAAVLVLDYALSSRIGGTLFMLTLPFSILFVAGYCTQRNGTVVVILLVLFSIVTESSPMFGFNFSKTISTASGAILALSIGPGMLTTDEWMARQDDLCF